MNLAIKPLASRGPEFTRACLGAARTWPLWSLAPALRAGANTPPDAPVVKEKMGPTIRSRGIYQLLYF